MAANCHWSGAKPPASCCDFTDVWRDCERSPSSFANDASEFAGKRVSRFVVVLVTPNNDFQDLRANLAPTLQGRAHPATERPIFHLRGRRVLIRRTSVPVTIKNMQRRTAILEPIRTNRQMHAVNRHHPKTIVAFHCATTGGQTNIRPMDFDESRGRPAGEPAKEKHKPLMAILAFPTRAAAFVVLQQRFGLPRNRDGLVITFRVRPLDCPG